MRQDKNAPAYFEPFLTPRYRAYLDERWDDIHVTHSRFLHPGEEEFITPEVIRAMSVTGTREEVITHLKELEAAGLT